MPALSYHFRETSVAAIFTPKDALTYVFQCNEQSSHILWVPSLHSDTGMYMCLTFGNCWNTCDWMKHKQYNSFSSFIMGMTGAFPWSELATVEMAPCPHQFVLEYADLATAFSFFRVAQKCLTRCNSTGICVQAQTDGLQILHGNPIILKGCFSCECLAQSIMDILSDCREADFLGVVGGS